MSVEIVAPSPAASARPIRISIPKATPALEHRRRPRRAEDHERQALADLARWFVERETQPHIVVDQQMNILVMNAAAKSHLAKSNLLEVSDRKLSFASTNHRESADRVLRDTSPQTTLFVRTGGFASSISLRRLPVLSNGSTTLLITISPASGIDCDRIQKEFGLTKAESEIALSIFKGLSLVKIAKERDASINTVKTQARYVFQKCRVHSQVALTRKIGQLVLW